MNTIIWIAQILLAIAFFMAGLGKITRPREELEKRMKYVEDLSDNQLRIIGSLEILAAIGLILPMLLNILPILTPLAAIGLILTMLGASALHVRRNEYPHILFNLVLLALAVFVVYGRLVAEAVV